MSPHIPSSSLVCNSKSSTPAPEPSVAASASSWTSGDMHDQGDTAQEHRRRTMESQSIAFVPPPLHTENSTSSSHHNHDPTVVPGSSIVNMNSTTAGVTSSASSPPPPPPPSIRTLSYVPLLHGLVQLQNSTNSNKTASSDGMMNSGHAVTAYGSSSLLFPGDDVRMPTSTTTAGSSTAAQGIIRQWWRRHQQRQQHTTKQPSHKSVAVSGIKKRSRSSSVTNDPCHTKRIKWSPTTTPVTKEEIMSSNRHWVWNMWQSYSHQERYYATKVLMQSFFDWTSPTTWTAKGQRTTSSSLSEDVIFHRRFECIRLLIAYIHPYIHVEKTAALPTPLPNLTEWCATFQFVLSHGLLRDASAAPVDDNDADTKTTVAIFRPSNEMVAIVYHYWPWFCATLWKFVNCGAYTTAQSLSYPQHVLAWIQMLYTFTIAAEDNEGGDLLPVMKLLNQHCLWNNKVLQVSETHSDSNISVQTTSTTTPSHLHQQRVLPVVELCPLAYLIATFYRIKDTINNIDMWSGKAMMEAQQLLGEMIQYRTTVRRVKSATTTSSSHGKTNSSQCPSNGQTSTIKASKDDATLSSIKTTKAGNATSTFRGFHSSSNTTSNNDKDIMIRFAEEDDDDDDDDVLEKDDDMDVIDIAEETAQLRQSKRDDSIDVLDELQSIIMHSDHSSDDSSNRSDKDDDDESQEDDHTILDEDDNDTVSSNKPTTNDTDNGAMADDTTTKTNNNDADKSGTATKTAMRSTAKRSAATRVTSSNGATISSIVSGGDEKKTARRPRMTAILPGRFEVDLPPCERAVLPDSEMEDVDHKENDDDEDDEPMPDDDDDFIEDDEEDNDVMDFVELDPFIRDDSLHRYRTALEQQEKQEEAEEGQDSSENQIVDSSTNGVGTIDVMKGDRSKHTSPESDSSLDIIERRKLYILASMQVLALQRHTSEPKTSLKMTTSIVDKVDHSTIPKKYLSIASENELIGSINKVVKPPTKPIVTKVVLRRAPTQEEFFRGSLSRNPVPVNMLLNNNSHSNTNSTANNGDTSSSDKEATIYDLRQYIANDLQMSDSAELIEIIVANKILDVNLKIRVVQQVLWKKSLIENPNSSNGRDHHHESTFSALLASSGTTGFFTSGSAMSFLLSTGVGSSGSSHSRGSGRVTADTPLAQLPPMIATYRLAGVDGEATEETVGVSDLIDPEAVSDTASSEEKDAMLEAEFGMTRYVTTGHGIEALLRSVQDHVNDSLRRIRRDSKGVKGLPNPARLELKQCPPCQGLILLRYCAKLAINRKRMLEARAPTILLALLIDILKALEETSASEVSITSNDSNPTAEILQELIELLTSDISSVGTGSQRDTLSHTKSDIDMINSNPDTGTKDASSMSLLLQSIENIALSSPLRIVVAKLLPFLTYGQPDLCRELALHFDKHITNETLINWEISGSTGISDNASSYEVKNSILTNTFIQTALVLPANDVCDSLRKELINCRIIESIVNFITLDIPDNPAPWTPALWPGREQATKNETFKTPGQKEELMNDCVLPNTVLEDSWRKYYKRPGVRTAFKVLNGLCRYHGPTQVRIASQDDFIRVCHWLESTSDSTSVTTDGLGILAETLLDEMISDNKEVDQAVQSIRNITRLRKKELAQEQRNRALFKITSFGGVSNIDSSQTLLKIQTTQPNIRQGLASILAPVVGLFQSTTDTTVSRSNKAASNGKSTSGKSMPSWFSEVEDMQDEVGLTCAVCQEGCTLQPSELLGLYIYIKKISISIDNGGSSSAIDGTNLLEALPPTLPDSLLVHPEISLISKWFVTTQSVVVNVCGTDPSKLTSSSSRHRQHVSYTTSVTAGNGIHYSCHRRARQADRSHPKAPKSEWEGATLRNSRVNCNAILPIVHGPNQSKIPLVTMESALSGHSEIVSIISGTSSSRSALWSVLHDLRLLLLRISYNESLSSECGGGSLASNCQLLYHQIYLARIRDRNATMVHYDHQSEQSMHAHGLAAAVLLATALVNADPLPSTSPNAASLSSSIAVLTRHLADAAPMGALTSVIFPHEKDSNIAAATDTEVTASTSQWNVGHTFFLQALVVCAGRRHARGITGSGCISSPGHAMDEDRGEDDDDDDDDEDNDTEQEEEEDNDDSYANVENMSSFHDTSNADKMQRQTSRAIRGNNDKSTLVCDDFRAPLRPLLTYYLILIQVHEDLTTGPLSNGDEDKSKEKEDSLIGTVADPIETCVERLVTLVTSCWKCRSIQELISKLPKSLRGENCTYDVLLRWFQQGMMSA